MKLSYIILSAFILLSAGSSMRAEETTLPEEIEKAPLSEQITVGHTEESISQEQIKKISVPEQKAAGLQNLPIGGYIQMWYINEQVENGKQQDVTKDKAVQEASGFSINKARIFIEGNDSLIKGRIELRLEGGSVGLLDAFAFINPIGKMLCIGAGQMKIPSTYEVGTGDSSLDFTTRSYFSSVVANWSLSKSTSTTSPLYNVQTYQRDTGAALKGDIYGLSYFLMAGNGLGANLFVGGAENKQYVYANGYGAYFYGIRASFDFINPLGKKFTGNSNILSSFCIDGHYNKNNHPDILYNDAKTVLDIKRKSWSFDMRMIILDRFRFTWMYGKGIIDDDYDYDGETDYKYRGWEIKVIAEIIKNTLDLGFRYDTYIHENSTYGAEERFNFTTAGVTFKYEPHLKFQLNYKWKILDSALNNETKDNILTLAAQYQL